MATGTHTKAPATPSAVVPVRLPDGTIRHDLRAVKIVWQRELIRFFQDRSRIISSLLQPVLFLFVLGTGLSTLVSGGTGGLNLRTFIFPGVLAMATMFTAIFSAGSIVWDREFGFLREMLVAPVRRAPSCGESASAAPPWRRSRASSSWPWRERSAYPTPPPSW